MFKSNKGITFEKIDGKKTSRVKVRTDNYTIGTYKFKYLSGIEFKSPFISWENLNSCGGWDCDNEYLKTAVQRGRKLCAGIKFDNYEDMLDYINSIDKIKFNYKDFAWEEGSNWRFELDIARKGFLCDYYDYYRVIGFYVNMEFPMGIIDMERFNILFHCDINDLLNGYIDYNYRNNFTFEDYIITGLLLGYPLESTISSIYDLINHNLN